MQLTETRRESQAGYAHPPANQAKHFSRLGVSTTRINIYSLGVSNTLGGCTSNWHSFAPALVTRSGAAPYNPVLATLGGYAYMLTLAFTPLALGVGDTLGGCASNWHPSVPALTTRSGASPRIGMYSPDVSNTLGGCALRC
jgi:hypothetical protein